MFRATRTRTTAPNLVVDDDLMPRVDTRRQGNKGSDAALVSDQRAGFAAGPTPALPAACRSPRRFSK